MEKDLISLSTEKLISLPKDVLTSYATRLEDQLKKIDSERSLVTNTIFKLNHALFTKNTGFSVGSEILYEGKRGVIKYLSNSLDLRFVKPRISLYRKDNILSQREIKIYSWQMKELKLNPQP